MFMMIMDDLSWGITYDVPNGLTFNGLLSIIDDLAEFHTFQMSCREQTVERYLKEGLIKKGNDHFIKKMMKSAVASF